MMSSNISKRRSSLEQQPNQHQPVSPHKINSQQNSTASSSSSSVATDYSASGHIAASTTAATNDSSSASTSASNRHQVPSFQKSSSRTPHHAEHKTTNFITWRHLPRRLRLGTSLRLSVLFLLLFGIVFICFSLLFLHNYGYLVSGAASVGNDNSSSRREKVKMIAVITTPTLFHRMNLMRKTHKNTRDVRYFFILGDSHKHGWFTRLRVLFEQIWYRDIWITPAADYDDIPLPMCVMTPHSSTSEKVYWAIKEAVRRFDFEYLVRLGDDAYFRDDYYLGEKVPLILESMEGSFRIGGGEDSGLLKQQDYSHVTTELDLSRNLESQVSTTRRMTSSSEDAQQQQKNIFSHNKEPLSHHSSPEHRLSFLHGHFWGPGTCDNTFYGAKWKYALGMGYVMTQRVAEFIASLDLHLLQTSSPEDNVFTAWVFPLKLKYIHDEDFHNVGKQCAFTLNSYEPHAWKPCYRSDVLLHYVSTSMYLNEIDPTDGSMQCKEKDYRFMNGKMCRIPAPEGYRSVNNSGLDMTPYTEAFFSITDRDQVNLPPQEAVRERLSYLQ